MANPIKVVKGIKKATKLPGGKKGRAIESKVRKESGMPKGITTGKAKALKRREVAEKDIHTFQRVGGYSLLKKATSNKKIGASNRAGRGVLNSANKREIRNDRKEGLALEPKWFNSERKDEGRLPWQFTPAKPKVPVKKRGK